MRFDLATPAALLALALACAATPAAAQGLSVTGLDGQTKVLTAEQLAALPRESAKLTEDGVVRTYEGPVLAFVLRAAGAPMGLRLHGDPLKAYLVVTGADGFFTVYSPAEVDKEFHDDVVILADRRDGAKLPEKLAPWRLVSGGDRKTWRSVYAVKSIEIRSVAAPPGAKAQGDHTEH